MNVLSTCNHCFDVIRGDGDTVRGGSLRSTFAVGWRLFSCRETNLASLEIDGFSRLEAIIESLTRKKEIFTGCYRELTGTVASGGRLGNRICLHLSAPRAACTIAGQRTVRTTGTRQNGAIVMHEGLSRSPVNYTLYEWRSRHSIREEEGTAGGLPSLVDQCSAMGGVKVCTEREQVL